MKTTIALVLAMVLALAACSTDSSSRTGTDMHDDSHTQVMGKHEDMHEGDFVEIEVEAKQWEFIPATITVHQGDRVQLHIRSTDVTHGFAIPSFGINERLAPNQDVHVEFTADKKGTFDFFCSVPCGRGHGQMRGQLVVE